jgi:hypothetical protein
MGDWQMSDQLWVVRAGVKAKFADEFVSHNFVAINFADFASDDLSDTIEATLRARAITPADRNYASQLSAFAYAMQQGDLVIVPRVVGKNPDYLVARIAGDYQYSSAAGPIGSHRRAVTWLGAFGRDALSRDASNTMGAIQTVFRPGRAEAELRNLIASLAPVVADEPSARSSPDQQAMKVEPKLLPAATRETHYSDLQLDVTLDQSGRAKITCAHPALIMEQVPRHLDPGAEWDKVPGIYVLTGTELEQSASRTGLERTLTTTSIVRPWAYVGLSEGLRPRLTSHRQAKEQWRRALLVRSNGSPFGGDDIRYLERRVHDVLTETGEVRLDQVTPHGNVSAQPRNLVLLDACADAVVAVLRLTGTLI